jgi:hypothetical protein
MFQAQEALRLEPEKKVLLAVLNIDIGSGHYDDLIKKSHVTYAERHGYDFSVINDWVNQTHKGINKLINWQKLLIPGMDKHAQYDYVVVVDYDILITPLAPAIHTAAQFGDRIGAVDDMQPNTAANTAIKTFLHCPDHNASAYYSLAGFNSSFNKILNTGMLVTQPRKHMAILQQIYDTHWNTQLTHPRSKDGHFEQAAIGYELHARDMLEWLPATWNFLAGWYELNNMLLAGSKLSLQKICSEEYFIHGTAGFWKGKLVQCAAFSQHLKPLELDLATTWQGKGKGDAKESQQRA